MLALNATKLWREHLQNFQADYNAEAPQPDLFTQQACSVILELPRHLWQKPGAVDHELEPAGS